MNSITSLKSEFLRLLREDEEFRLAVAGLLGLDEVLRELRRLREDFNTFVKEQERRWEENSKRWEENNKRWEENNRRWEETYKRFETLELELRKLREDFLLFVKEQEKRWEENNRRWEENNRRWEENNRRWEENNKRWEEAYKRFEAIELEIKRLRDDMNRMFASINRRITALGARWGIESEEAFRESMRAVIEEEFGFRVEKWKSYDEKGEVFGYPAEIEIDIAIHNDRIVLLEIKSAIEAEDVYVFNRKALFYEKVAKRRVDRKIIVSPFVEEKAFEIARKLGIELYTKT